MGGADEDSMTTDRERISARLDAFRLVEAVQQRRSTEALARAQARAREQDWPEVTRVLLYAEVVAGQTAADPAVAEPITRLHDLADAAGDHAMLSAALASRADHHLTSDDLAVRQGSFLDLARATALLELSAEPPLERATAYVACAAAYSARELWELEEELYAAVTPVLAQCELPVLDFVVRFNRAEAVLRLLCGLREVDATEELHERAPAARAAVDDALRAPMVADWLVEVEVFGHLLDALVGSAPRTSAEELTRRASAEITVGSDSVLGMLQLAEALAAADDGDWQRVTGPALRAAELSTDEFATSVRSLAGSLLARAEASGGGRSAAALDYALYCSRRRWELRQQMVGSARASLHIEQLRIERDRHARAARVDDLTGLANRRGYSRHLQELRRRRVGNQLAVLLLDIDTFKSVNDSYGHAVGDQVLVRVADTLASGTRAVDLVARLGGDEFVALLDGLDTDAARRRATDLRRRLAEVPWDDLAPGLRVAVSIGVTAGAPDSDPEDLVSRADTALYAAKARGGDRVEVDRGA
jgi:diguanylate cyclase (GGDEF)-like protein